MQSRVTLDDIHAAAAVIKGKADNTPLVPSPHFSEVIGRPLYLKLESMQATGAFKLRGAMNAVAKLPEGTRGVVCASTGNHGRAVAFAAAARGLRAVVCLSSQTPQPKIDGIRAAGGEVSIAGEDQVAAEREATRLATEEGLTELPPFDHPDVIAGQGTIGLELLGALPDLGTVILPLSGGGLAAGVGLAIKSLKPQVRVIGVTMEEGAAMHLSMAAGHPVPVEEKPSFADALTGGIGDQNRYTLPLCREVLDDSLLVSEAGIYHALQALYHEERLVAEGACVVGLAALLSGRLDLPAGPVAVIITGRNVDMNLFTRIITGHDIRLGDLFIQGTPYRRP